MKLLNLGCGNSYHKDWINIDFISNSEYVVPHNLLEGIPFDNCSIDVIYHSHVLEHFSKSDGENFLRECYRVLRCGGIIRVVVPDLESIAKEYIRNLTLAIEGDEDAVINYNWIKLELLDQMVRNKSGGEMEKYLHQPNIPNESYVISRIGLEGKNIRNNFLNKLNQTNLIADTPNYKPSKLKLFKKSFKKLLNKILVQTKLQLPQPDPATINIGEFRLSGEVHHWMYDRYSLSKLLLETGFKDIQVCSAFESNIKDWGIYELDVNDREVRKPDSLFMEARKK